MISFSTKKGVAKRGRRGISTLGSKRGKKDDLHRCITIISTIPLERKKKGMSTVTCIPPFFLLYSLVRGGRELLELVFGAFSLSTRKVKRVLSIALVACNSRIPLLMVAEGEEGAGWRDDQLSQPGLDRREKGNVA